MTSSVETSPVPEAPEQQSESYTADERRAALAHKFGTFASTASMSDADINKWFRAATVDKSEEELMNELTQGAQAPQEGNDSTATQEKKSGFVEKVTLVPRAVWGVPTLAEAKAYKGTTGAKNIDEARKLYKEAMERTGEDKLTTMGRLNNRYMLNVLKRAERRAARSTRYDQKIQRRKDETPEQHAKRMRRYEIRRRAATTLSFAAATAIYLGTRAHAFDWVHDQVVGGGNHHDVKLTASAHDVDASQRVDDMANFGNFKYDHNLDPFYLPGKEGIHDFGAPLHPDIADGNKPAGWTDWTNTRMVHSPEQLASIATGMNIDGQQDSNMNQLAEQFKDVKGGPKLMSHYHDEVMKILNDKNTKIHEEPITGPYASLYEWDQNGDGVLTRDDYVNKPDANGSYGTKMVIEFTDQAGHRQVMEIRKECGGQRIWACVVPVQEVSYSAPQSSPEYTTVAYVQQDAPVSHPKPQGNGTPPHHDTPPAPQPPAERPPAPQPPAPQPPAPQPPVVQPPAPKPPEHKGNEYPSNNFVAPTGPGNFMQTPAQVETQHQTQPNRNAGVPQGSILDNILKAPGAETGGQKHNSTPGLNTSGNTGGSKIGTPEVGKPTNSGKVGSSL
jgi:hypothetical protein